MSKRRPPSRPGRPRHDPAVPLATDRDGKVEPEYGARVAGFDQLDFAAVGVHQLARDGEAQPVAVGLPRTHERLEKTPTRLHRNARAAIIHRERKPANPAGPGPRAPT